MARVATAEGRSRIMRAIRSSNTGPEILVRRSLHREGFRFRINVKSLPGKPDIVLRKYQAVIMVHGCFWHGHALCGAGRTPRANSEYWAPKLIRTKERDKEARRALLDLGWRVLTIWECALIGRDADPHSALRYVAEWLRSDRRAADIPGG